MRIPPLLVSSLAVTATAVSGSVATDPDSDWYRDLDKPDWQPPGVAFPVVWTALYATLAGATAKAYEHLPPEQRARYVREVMVNLTLNAGWSWLFFRSHNLPLAALGAAALAVSTIRLAVRSGKADKAAGAWLVPYALWTCFATVLSTDILLRNPDEV
ncbi:TspO/MBR family protein [Microlunatus sp. Y2014]|uniref:TspO/MBR family protein n=1 Tax=Microlunatus sp. Y2014 TaxID=3418488 RepID=UPI003DA6CFED